MNFQPLLSVADFVTILTLILESGWEVFRLDMVPDLMPPNMTELSTDVTAPLVASWGLGTETKQVRGGLGGEIVTTLG